MTDCAEEAIIPRTPPNGEEEAERRALAKTGSWRPGLFGWLITTDHKAIAV